MKLGEICSTDRVLQIHQVSLHSDEKNDSFISNTFKGRAGELGLRYVCTLISITFFEFPAKCPFGILAASLKTIPISGLSYNFC